MRGLRIAVLSDIHSNLEALESVITSLGTYDALFCLGDLVGYGAQPNEVIERVHRLRPQMLIAGNHDYAVANSDTSGFAPHAAAAVEWTRNELRQENMDYLMTLPQDAAFKDQGLQVKAYHGSPKDPLNEYIFSGTPEYIIISMIESAGADVLLVGHTHTPMNIRTGSGHMFNPGSVGQPRDGDPRASFGFLYLEGREVWFEVKRVNYDIDSAAKKILEQPVPRFLADRLYLGY